MKVLFDLGGKNVLRLGLLVLSTLLIVGGSVFFYDRLVYERALSVGGVITGSGSTTQTGLNPAPGTILILAVSAVLISLSLVASGNWSTITSAVNAERLGGISQERRKQALGAPVRL